MRTRERRRARAEGIHAERGGGEDRTQTDYRRRRSHRARGYSPARRTAFPSFRGAALSHGYFRSCPRAQLDEAGRRFRCHAPLAVDSLPTAALPLLTNPSVLTSPRDYRRYAFPLPILIGNSRAVETRHPIYPPQLLGFIVVIIFNGHDCCHCRSPLLLLLFFFLCYYYYYCYYRC